jgi:hypothetical protein
MRGRTVAILCLVLAGCSRTEPSPASRPIPHIVGWKLVDGNPADPNRAQLGELICQATAPGMDLELGDRALQDCMAADGYLPLMQTY